MQSLVKLTGAMSLCALLGCTAVVQWLTLGSAIEDRWGEVPRSGETEAGVRELLRVSAGRAVSQASDPDGAWLEPSLRIRVPAQMRAFGSAAPGDARSCPVDRLELDLNSAAQRAAPGALGALTSQIRALRLTDPHAVVEGGPTSATELFRGAAAAQLVDRVSPVVAVQLRELDLYALCGELDRRLPDAPAASPPLVRHVAQGMVDGLLALIAREETRLRADPTSRTSPALRALFERSAEADVR